MEVVGSASDSASIAARVDELEPDVVLADLEDSDELSALAAEAAFPPMVLLTSGPAGDLLRAGVRAVLPHGAGAAELGAAIEAAAAGLVVVHPDELPSLVPMPARAPAAGAEELTPREAEVLRMLAEGHGNKTIAWKLGISEHTVKFHVASIMSKLQAGSRTEAVTAGFRQGLIML
jgi:DNA-binding NarL/FixJ family response regulator